MSNQELLILAILSETERYGYELKAIAANRKFDLWQNIALSSVYSVLQKLSRKGYLSYREVSQSSKPPRKLFEITPSGREALENTLLHNVNPRSGLLGQFELILAVWPILSDERRREILLSYRDFLRNRRDILYRLTSEEINPISRANYERPLRIIDAELSWLSEFATNMGITIN